MLIRIKDPENSSGIGALDTREEFNLETLLKGDPVNFFISDTLSSSDPKELFNLEPPPEFSDQPMVSGQLEHRTICRTRSIPHLCQAKKGGVGRYASV
jgi:hypothetical protein